MEIDGEDLDTIDEALLDSVRLLNQQIEWLLLRRHGVTHLEQLKSPQRAVFFGHHTALWRQMLHIGTKEYEEHFFETSYRPNVRPLRDEIYVAREDNEAVNTCAA